MCLVWVSRYTISFGSLSSLRRVVLARIAIVPSETDFLLGASRSAPLTARSWESPNRRCLCLIDLVVQLFFVFLCSCRHQLQNSVHIGLARMDVKSEYTQVTPSLRMFGDVVG